MSELMTRDDVMRIIEGARASGRRINLRGINLSGGDLRDLNLRGADLAWADLSYTNFRRAKLTSTSLRGADLTGVDLSYTSLRGTVLYSANLRGTDLSESDLNHTQWHGLAVNGLYPYRCLLVPLPSGWQITIGCWSGTVTALRELIAKDDGWPEAVGKEIVHRRPLLAAFADMCDAHIAGKPGVIEDLAEKWGSE